MRAYDESDKYDAEELARLNAAPWMLAALALNPQYVHWGPHEDYMWTKGEGWNSPVYVSSWPEFTFELNDLNECCNFYFQIERDSENCSRCGGNGIHPDGQWVTESFYRHSSPFKARTMDEEQTRAMLRGFDGPGATHPKSPLEGKGYPSIDVLAHYGEGFRLFCEDMRRRAAWGDGLLTADETKALDDAGRGGDRGPLGHDAINRGILCETRCKRLGVPYRCDACDGHGTRYTEPAAHLSLVLWWMHPRKGATRGIEIKRLGEEELRLALTFLAKAAARNADRFSKVVAAAGESR